MATTGHAVTTRSPGQFLSAHPQPYHTSSSSTSLTTNAQPPIQEDVERGGSPDDVDQDVYEMSDTKRSKREPCGKKIRSCIYCRRSHMVCDTERPCRRCKKRGITDLCIEDSKLASRQLEARAARAAKKRANTGSGGSMDESSGSGSGFQVPTLHKKRRTSSDKGSRGARPVEQDGFIQTWPLAQRSTPPPINTRPEDGFYMGNSSSQPQQGEASDAMDQAWSFGAGSTMSVNNTMREATAKLLDAPSDISTIWQPNDGINLNLNILNPTGLDVNMPFGSDIFPSAGPSSSTTNIQGPNGNDTGGRPDDQNRYLNVALNNVPRRATAERGGEFGVLSEYLESLGIPSLPGGLGDVFTETTQTINPYSISGFTRTDAMNPDQSEGSRMVGIGNTDIGSNMIGLDDLEDYGIDWSALGRPLMGLFNIETNSKRTVAESNEDIKPLIPEASNTEKFYLAAADQQSGTRDERLKKVIQAKYEAGLLKPYDYARGYARMYKWLEKNVSQASIQAILRPMSVFRPAFRAIAQSLSDLDLIFVEEAFERLMLDYDRVFSAIHTPACLWRRTGEIYKGNKEMSNLTGIPSQCFRGGNLGIFQLMDEESIVKYYQLFGSIAFDINTKSVNTVCTLHIPAHLTKTPQGDNTVTHTPALASPALGPAPTHPFYPSRFNSPTSSPPQANRAKALTSSVPPLTLGRSISGIDQAYGTKIIKCALNFTIRRDSWGMPIAIIGNWIPF